MYNVQIDTIRMTNIKVTTIHVASSAYGLFTVSNKKELIDDSENAGEESITMC